MKYNNFVEIKKAKDAGELEDSYFFIDNDYLTLEKKVEDDVEENPEQLFRIDGSGCSEHLLKEVLEHLGFEVQFA
jgi:hypothetical protein